MSTTVTPSLGFAARVFRPDGNTMMTVHILPGDVVEWKRNGTAGSYRGTVLKIGKTIRLRIESWMNCAREPREVNVRTGFHHAWRNGRDLAAP